MRTATALLGAVVLSLLLAGCGSSGAGEDVTASDATPSVGAEPSVVVTTAPVDLPTSTPPATSAPSPTAQAVAAPTVRPALPTAAATSEPSPTPHVAATATAVPGGGGAPSPTATVETRPTTPPAPVPTSPPQLSNEVLAANGGEVYGINCARCHGENGTGTDRYRGLIGVGARYSAPAMIDELTNGHPVTFGFAQKLSADEIASVVAYVKAVFP